MRIHISDYAKNLDALLKILSILSYFANILPLFVQLSKQHYFEFQTYIQFISHLKCFKIFLKIYSSICQYFNKIACQ